MYLKSIVDLINYYSVYSLLKEYYRLLEIKFILIKKKINKKNKNI